MQCYEVLWPCVGWNGDLLRALNVSGKKRFGRNWGGQCVPQQYLPKQHTCTSSKRCTRRLCARTAIRAHGHGYVRVRRTEDYNKQGPKAWGAKLFTARVMHCKYSPLQRKRPRGNKTLTATAIISATRSWSYMHSLPEGETAPEHQHPSVGPRRVHAIPSVVLTSRRSYARPH